MAMKTWLNVFVRLNCPLSNRLHALRSHFYLIRDLGLVTSNLWLPMNDRFGLVTEFLAKTQKRKLSIFKILKLSTLTVLLHQNPFKITKRPLRSHVQGINGTF